MVAFFSATTTTGALRREGARGRRADALAGAGDDGDLALETACHGDHQSTTVPSAHHGVAGMQDLLLERVRGDDVLVDLDAEARQFGHVPAAVGLR